MSVIIILLIASLAVASAFLGAFIWSVRSGQYDDDYTPSVRILFEDKKPNTSIPPEGRRSEQEKNTQTTIPGK